MLSKSKVLHIANLARIELTENEITRLQSLLSETLEYIDILNELDLINIEPTSQVTGLENIWREDKIGETQTLTQGEVLSNAPQKENGYFKVPLVIEK